MFIYSLNITDNNDYFIYSVTTSKIYSVTVTTSESTVNCWKPATSDIFTDSDNNHLAGRY